MAKTTKNSKSSKTSKSSRVTKAAKAQRTTKPLRVTKTPSVTKSTKTAKATKATKAAKTAKAPILIDVELASSYRPSKINSNAPAIALMCKSRDYEYMPSTNTFVTGDWVISTKKQEALLGNTVILTEGQRSSAYIGGRIVGFVPTNKRTAQTQCKVVFQADSNFVGDTTAFDHYNWGTGRSVCYLD